MRWETCYTLTSLGSDREGKEKKKVNSHMDRIIIAKPKVLVACKKHSEDL